MRLLATSEKFGSLGTLVSAMGCASCFPVLGSIGATLGLGFLAQFEGIFINTLLPVFAGVVLVLNLVAGLRHRRVSRTLLGIAGPAMVLATLYLFWTDAWSTWMFYLGLTLMLLSSILDLARPPQRACPAKVGIRIPQEAGKEHGA